MSFFKKLFRKRGDLISPDVLLPEPSKPTLADPQNVSLEQALHTVVLISSSFESPDGFSAVVGNFDGEGLTCGALGFTWKYGRQQQLILEAEAKYPGLATRLMPDYGKTFLTYAAMPVMGGSFQNIANMSDGNGHVFPQIKTELMAYWGSPEMTEIQLGEALHMGQHALIDAQKWAKDARNSDAPTLHELAFFFDVGVQNGSMEGISFSSIQSCMGPNLDHNLQTVLNFCKSNSNKDCQRNAILWNKVFENATDNQKNLLIVGYLRARKARTQYIPSVLNRRGTLSVMQGYVNQELRNFYSQYPYLLSDLIK